MVLFPSDIVTTINRPLDAKSNVLTLAERNAIPVTQRYKGMVVVVQNLGGDRSGIYWLPTNNLTNTGWEEIDLDGSNFGVREYVHVQIEPEDRWLIQHNFDTRHRALSIFVVDGSNEQIVGQINTQLSTNNLLVYDFSEPLKGRAYVKF